MTIECKICGCKLPADLFEEGDNCLKCDDNMYDAQIEQAEAENEQR